MDYLKQEKLEIYGMSTLEAGKLVDQTIMRYQVGLIKREAAISKLDRISLEEAKVVSTEIEKREDLVIGIY